MISRAAEMKAGSVTPTPPPTFHQYRLSVKCTTIHCQKFMFFSSIAIRYWNRLGLAKQQRNQFGSDNNRAGDVPYLSQ